MISDRAIAALRCNAAVLAATSGVRLRISHEGRPIFEISHPPFPTEPPCPLIPTCRFRAAVARAYADQAAGRPVAMCGLPQGTDPQISYGVTGADRVLPGGALRLERDGRWLHVAAFPRPEATVDDHLLRDGHADAQPLVDDELDVTLVCVTCASGDELSSSAAIDRLNDLAAHVAIAEIEAHLAAMAVPRYHDDGSIHRREG